jgi:lysozyme
MKVSLKLALLLTAGAVVCGAIVVTLFYYGVLKFNNPSPARYPVRGVDVSSYQGDIDWDILSRQGISFAFIKATEGSSFADRYFDANFANALKTGLRVGAYHFFSFDSPGETQAANFIAHVPKIEGALPPAVDFEFYGDKEQNPPDPEEARKNLNILLDRLESYYGVKPIIYATEQIYDMYLAGCYEAYGIWIRNIFTKPKPLENQTWLFWQYTSRARLKGYRGPEYYIDMNVFNGTMDEFVSYGSIDK